MIVWTLLQGVGFVVTQIVAIFGINIATEQPPYNILVTLPDGVEIRNYAARVVAATEIDVPDTNLDTVSAARSEGFRRIAGYIFGQNIAMTSPVELATPAADASTASTASTSIAMTAPVDMSEAAPASGGQVLTMRFMMPSEYRLDTLPQPKDDRVKLYQIDPVTLAVLRYRGLAGESQARQQTELLRQALAASPWQMVGTAGRMVYNPPWTLPPLRRNEVYFEVSLKPQEDAS